ncbi:YxiJ family protein [Gottfriedia sp. NPDC056225]|uniref:YxiJ family protein n=1 Tax=Gottfriedia sp. NPDC056225 TaxID=3345751 RepID=UPI0035D9EDE2
MENIINQLNDIKFKLDNPFPYRDTDKIQEDFKSEFSSLPYEKDCLTGDFNDFCMNIAGTLSYVLGGKQNKVPKGQVELLRFSFFERFSQYKFIENNLTEYKEFNQEFKVHEETRCLLLKLFAKK